MLLAAAGGMRCRLRERVGAHHGAPTDARAADVAACLGTVQRRRTARCATVVEGILNATMHDGNASFSSDQT